MNLRLIGVLLIIVGTAGMYLSGFMAGQRTAKLSCNSKITEIKQAAATAEAARLSAVNQALVAEKERGDAATARLAATESKINTLNKERIHALNQVTGDHVCFGADALRLLNDTNYSNAHAAVPNATASTDASSTGIATDTDVANWIINAQEQYELCRARFSALVDFVKGQP